MADRKAQVDGIRQEFLAAAKAGDVWEGMGTGVEKLMALGLSQHEACHMLIGWLDKAEMYNAEHANQIEESLYV